ncbi:hypothetical protein SO802_025575 [Lithocarpus litseifolius]
MEISEMEMEMEMKLRRWRWVSAMVSDFGDERAGGESEMKISEMEISEMAMEMKLWRWRWVRLWSFRLQR